MQHYLLSETSRNLSLKQIFRLSEDEAFTLMKAARWGTPDNPNNVVCPRIDVIIAD